MTLWIHRNKVRVLSACMYFIGTMLISLNDSVVGNNSQVSSLFSDPSQGSQNSSARMDLSAFRADSLQPCTPVNNSVSVYFVLAFHHAEHVLQRPKQVSSALKSSSITASDKKKERQEKFKDKNERRYDWLLDIKDEQGKRAGDADYDPRTLYIPKAAWKEFTPFEKQFWEIKSKHWDKVVFFKKGKFYGKLVLVTTPCME